MPESAKRKYGRVLGMAAIALVGAGLLYAHALFYGDKAQARECYRIGDYARAQKFFERAIDKHPSDFEARYGYALAMQELALAKKVLGEDEVSDWLDVVKAYEISSKVGSSPSQSPNHAFALFHLSNKLYQLKNYGQAREYLKLARSVEPRNKYVLNLAGIVSYKSGEYGEAQQTLEYLLAIDPDFISAYLNLGNVLWESGEAEAALVTWKQGLGRSPGNGALIQRMDLAVKKIGAQ